MSPADQDLHFVLCDFGRHGRAYVETDPAEADASTIVRKLLQRSGDRMLAGRLKMGDASNADTRP
jgi:hypothetical protein